MTDPNHVLYYTSPAPQWSQALPIGNGRIGGMVWGGTRVERISLNEETIWSGGPYTPAPPSARNHLETIQNHIFRGEYAQADALATEKFMGIPGSMACYQPVGEAVLEMEGVDEFRVEEYRRELDLDTALTTVSYRSKGYLYQRKVFIHPERNVLVLRLECDFPGKISFNLTANSPHNATLETVGEDVLKMAGRCSMDNGMSGAIRFQAGFQVVTDGGETTSAEDHLRVRGADSVMVLVSIATNFAAYNDLSVDYERSVEEHLESVAKISYAELQSECIMSHRSLYRRVQLDLGSSDTSFLPIDDRLDAFRDGRPDPSLCTLYHNYGRYLLIASSRNCRQASNLQGIWNDSLRPNWQSKFTININTEMNYWPSEPANLPETLDPLISLVRDLSETGRHTASAMYGAGGWVAHHNTDIWRATAPIDLPMFGQWPLGGAWLCRHLWDRFDYGRDLDYLRSVWPIFRELCVFYLDTLKVDPASGYLVMTPSMSPENIHQHGTALCAGPTMDSQLLRDLFTWTLDAGKVLEMDRHDAKELCERIKAARGRLRPTEVGSGGQIKEWQEDWDALVPDTHHRHTSHLYALYPSDQITPTDTPDLAAAARVTLDTRGEAGTGWATAWRMNLWARLQEPEKAYEMVRWLLSRDMCFYNLFDAHPPLDKTSVSVFQIDGNLGGSAGILEMLVQSVKEHILILPALPNAWPKGKVRGVRVRGGWEVDVQWSGGALQEIRVIAVLGGGRRQVEHRGKTVVVELERGQSEVYDLASFA